MIPRIGLRSTTSLLVLLTAACSDRDLPTAAPMTRPALSISDGANGGNSHFFFLPPIVPAPSPNGAFDGTVSPEVRICEWNGSSCVALIATFSLTAGTGGELIKVDPVAQHYHVNWQTKLFVLGLGKQYRISVLVGAQELGHADVNPISGGQGLKNVDTGEYIALKDGSTLPIKFRIEVGAISGPEEPVFADDELSAVATGALFTCGLKTDGAAYCWGNNQWGELGSGATGPDSYTPLAVTGGHQFVALVAGIAHACGLKASGEAWCWGDNADAQLGIGATSAPKPSPQLVVGGHSFAALTSGTFHTCGRTTAGEVWCWGYGQMGALGNGVQGVSPTPVKVAAPAGTTFTWISSGNGHVCGLTTAGPLYCWGGNFAGQTGIGTTGSPVLVPTLAASGYSFASVFAGGNHTCGLTAAGAAHCWGSNDGAQLGRGFYSSEEVTVGPVQGGLSFVRLALGQSHTCGLTASGAAYCWGQNDVGQIGTGSASGDPNEPDWFIYAPVAVTGGNVFSTIDLGHYQSCGVTTSGVAKCWGSNVYSILGNPNPDPAPSPVAVVGAFSWATP
jgi:alpha-tubulin suppressor-like RCC1 family protein